MPIIVRLFYRFYARSDTCLFPQAYCILTYMPETEQKFSPEEEIRELERRLEVKKRELAANDAEPVPEKSILGEVLKTHIEDATRAAMQPSSAAPSVIPSTPSPQVKKQVDDLRTMMDKEQVESLVEIAFSKGLVDAVETARHLNNPHILDAFHDALVDTYYDKLLALRGIPSE